MAFGRGWFQPSVYLNYGTPLPGTLALLPRSFDYLPSANMAKKQEPICPVKENKVVTVINSPHNKSAFFGPKLKKQSTNSGLDVNDEEMTFKSKFGKGTNTAKSFARK